MRKLGIWIAMDTAIAAALAQPLPAVADDTLAKTHLTAEVTPRWVAPGETATITGTLTTANGPLAGQTVTLYAHPAKRSGAVVAVSTAVTADDGKVSFTVTPTRTSPHVYRLGYAGDTTSRRTLSRAVVVGVKFRTCLRVTSTDTESGAVVVGRLTGRGHHLKNRHVTLQAWDGTAWVTVRVKTTRARGLVRFAVTDPGTYRLRVTGGKRFLPCASPSVTTA